jgi:Ca-activated chloride channel family protein
MRFAEPAVLFLLLAIPVIAALGWLGAIRRRRALREFAGGTAGTHRFVDQVSPHRRAVALLLLLFAVAAGVIAAARPQWGTRLEPVTRKGIDVVIVLDTSLSMAAQDVAPDRLGMAKHAADSLIKRLGGDRVAVVTFAGKATVACPLTLDLEAARLFLDAVDVQAVPVPGTALAEGIRVALRTLGMSQSAQTRSRAVVVFSDGEDHEGGIDDAIASLRKGGVSAFAVGCGTQRGAPIPTREESGSISGYKKDRERSLVTSRLDDVVLGKLALDSGGRYFEATASEVEVDEIAKALAGMDAKESGTLLRARYEERFQIPLACALAALLVLTVLNDRKSRAGTGWLRWPKGGREVRT